MYALPTATRFSNLTEQMLSFFSDLLYVLATNFNWYFVVKHLHWSSSVVCTSAIVFFPIPHLHTNVFVSTGTSMGYPCQAKQERAVCFTTRVSMVMCKGWLRYGVPKLLSGGQWTGAHDGSRGWWVLLSPTYRDISYYSRQTQTSSTKTQTQLHHHLYGMIIFTRVHLGSIVIQLWTPTALSHLNICVKYIILSQYDRGQWSSIFFF